MTKADKCMLVVTPDEAEIIYKALEMYAEGLDLASTKNACAGNKITAKEYKEKSTKVYAVLDKIQGGTD